MATGYGYRKIRSRDTPLTLSTSYIFLAICCGAIITLCEVEQTNSLTHRYSGCSHGTKGAARLQAAQEDMQTKLLFPWQSQRQLTEAAAEVDRAAQPSPVSMPGLTGAVDVHDGSELLAALQTPGVGVIVLASDNISLDVPAWRELRRPVVISWQVALLGGGRYSSTGALSSLAGPHHVLDCAHLVNRLQLAADSSAPSGRNPAPSTALEFRGLRLRNHLPPIGYAPALVVSSPGAAVSYIDCVLERDVGLPLNDTAAEARMLQLLMAQPPLSVHVLSEWCPSTTAALPGSGLGRGIGVDTGASPSAQVAVPDCFSPALVYDTFAIDVHVASTPASDILATAAAIPTAAITARDATVVAAALTPSSVIVDALVVGQTFSSASSKLRVQLANCTYGVRHPVSSECVLSYGAEACVYQLQSELQFQPQLQVRQLQQQHSQQQQGNTTSTAGSSGVQCGRGAGLSAGAAAGIGVAATLGACLALLLLFRFIGRIRRGHRTLTMAVRPPGATPMTTLVVTDIQNSTNLWEQLPTTVMNEALRLHHRCLRALLLKCNGYESATEGDSFILAFHNPMDAARFALLAQQALMELHWPEELLEHQDGCEVWAEPARPKVVSGRLGTWAAHPHARSLGLGALLPSGGDGAPEDADDDPDGLGTPHSNWYEMANVAGHPQSAALHPHSHHGHHNNSISNNATGNNNNNSTGNAGVLTPSWLAAAFGSHAKGGGGRRASGRAHDLQRGLSKSFTTSAADHRAWSAPFGNSAAGVAPQHPQSFSVLAVGGAAGREVTVMRSAASAGMEMELEMEMGSQPRQIRPVDAGVAAVAPAASSLAGSAHRACPRLLPQQGAPRQLGTTASALSSAGNGGGGGGSSHGASTTEEGYGSSPSRVLLPSSPGTPARGEVADPTQQAGQSPGCGSRDETLHALKPAGGNGLLRSADHAHVVGGSDAAMSPSAAAAAAAGRGGGGGALTTDYSSGSPSPGGLRHLVGLDLALLGGGSSRSANPHAMMTCTASTSSFDHPTASAFMVNTGTLAAAVASRGSDGAGGGGGGGGGSSVFPSLTLRFASRTSSLRAQGAAGTAGNPGDRGGVGGVGGTEASGVGFPGWASGERGERSFTSVASGFLRPPQETTVWSNNPLASLADASAGGGAAGLRGGSRAAAPLEAAWSGFEAPVLGRTADEPARARPSGRLNSSGAAVADAACADDDGDDDTAAGMCRGGVVPVAVNVAVKNVDIVRLASAAAEGSWRNESPSMAGAVAAAAAAGGAVACGHQGLARRSAESRSASAVAEAVEAGRNASRNAAASGGDGWWALLPGPVAEGMEGGEEVQAVEARHTVMEGGPGACLAPRPSPGPVVEVLHRQQAAPPAPAPAAAPPALVPTSQEDEDVGSMLLVPTDDLPAAAAAAASTATTGAGGVQSQQRPQPQGVLGRSSINRKGSFGATAAPWVPSRLGPRPAAQVVQNAFLTTTSSLHEPVGASTIPSGPGPGQGALQPASAVGALSCMFGGGAGGGGGGGAIALREGGGGGVTSTAELHLRHLLPVSSEILNPATTTDLLALLMGTSGNMGGDAAGSTAPAVPIAGGPEAGPPGLLSSSPGVGPGAASAGASGAGTGARAPVPLHPCSSAPMLPTVPSGRPLLRKRSTQELLIASAVAAYLGNESNDPGAMTDRGSESYGVAAAAAIVAAAAANATPWQHQTQQQQQQQQPQPSQLSLLGGALFGARLRRGPGSGHGPRMIAPVSAGLAAQPQQQTLPHPPRQQQSGRGTDATGSRTRAHTFDGYQRAMMAMATAKQLSNTSLGNVALPGGPSGGPALMRMPSNSSLTRTRTQAMEMILLPEKVPEVRQTWRQMCAANWPLVKQGPSRCSTSIDILPLPGSAVLAQLETHPEADGDEEGSDPLTRRHQHHQQQHHQQHHHVGHGHGKAPKGAVMIFRGFRVRMGAHTGISLTTDVTFNHTTGHMAYSGLPLKIAKAVGDGAAGGSVLLSNTTFNLVHPHLPDLPGHPEALYCGDAQIELGIRSLYMLVARELQPRLGYLPALRNLRMLQVGNLEAPVGTVAICFMTVAGATKAVAELGQPAVSALQQFKSIVTRECCECGGFVVEATDGLCLAAFMEPAAAAIWALRCKEALNAHSWSPEVLSSPHFREVREYTKIYRGRGVPSRRAAHVVCRGPRIRTGIAVGPVTAEVSSATARLSYRGKVMNRSARVAAQAADNQILLSEAAWQRVVATVGIRAVVDGAYMGPGAAPGSGLGPSSAPQRQLSGASGPSVTLATMDAPCRTSLIPGIAAGGVASAGQYPNPCLAGRPTTTGGSSAAPRANNPNHLITAAEEILVAAAAADGDREDCEALVAAAAAVVQGLPPLPADQVLAGSSAGKFSLKGVAELQELFEIRMEPPPAPALPGSSPDLSPSSASGPGPGPGPEAVGRGLLPPASASAVDCVAAGASRFRSRSQTPLPSPVHPTVLGSSAPAAMKLSPGVARGQRLPSCDGPQKTGLASPQGSSCDAGTISGGGLQSGIADEAAERALQEPLARRGTQYEVLPGGSGNDLAGSAGHGVRTGATVDGGEAQQLVGRYGTGLAPSNVSGVEVSGLQGGLGSRGGARVTGSAAFGSKGGGCGDGLGDDTDEKATSNHAAAAAAAPEIWAEAFASSQPVSCARGREHVAVQGTEPGVTGRAAAAAAAAVAEPAEAEAPAKALAGDALLEALVLMALREDALEGLREPSGA